MKFYRAGIALSFIALGLLWAFYFPFLRDFWTIDRLGLALRSSAFIGAGAIACSLLAVFHALKNLRRK